MTAPSAPVAHSGTTIVDTDRRVFLVRIADQGMWSAGFFLVNATAGFTMSAVEYAAVSIASAIAFIAVAVMRSWGVYSFVVVSGRRRASAAEFVDGRAGWTGAVTAGAVGAALVGGWLCTRVPVGFAALCALVTLMMVLSDLPRQVIIARGDHRRTLPLSALYLVGGLAATAAFVLPVGAVWTLVGWLAVLVVVLAVGVVLAPRGRAETTDRAEQSRVAWRLTAEAFYLAAAGQAGLLLLYAMHDASSTAGFRFAYSLVFAPAFVVVQGLQPVMVRQAASAASAGPRRSADLAVTWAAAQTLLFVCLGAACGTGLWLFASAPGPRAAVAFIVPIGISVASAQIFESAILAVRFFVDPAPVHRGRLMMVLLDVASQLTGIVVGGPTGLAAALIAFGIIRVGVSLALLYWLRRASTTRVAANG